MQPQFRGLIALLGKRGAGSTYARDLSLNITGCAHDTWLDEEEKNFCANLDSSMVPRE